MPGTLYVVATPIGNLEDITLRALRVLRTAAVIAAEDTRRTSRLLQHHGLSTPTLSLHDHNERARTPQLLGRLAAGEDVALVSDAGTPTLADPGFHLVRAALDAGIRVEPVPGPSALTAALAIAGVPVETFTFVGFAPARAGERERWLQSLAGERRTIVLFEAPHRIAALLDAIQRVLGDRYLVIARELTKLHETVTRGWASELAAGQLEARGELTVLVTDQTRDGPPSRREMSDSELYGEFCQMTETGGSSRRAAIASLAGRHQMSTRSVYAAIERAKSSIE